MAGTSKLKAKELESYRKLLDGLRNRLRGDLDQMTDEALHRDQPEASGNLSKVPIHLADLGTDQFEQEFTLGLIETEQGTLDEVEGALQRIGEGTFGTCEECGKPINKARLQALPYTRHCIECARELEARLPG
ncbi:TraR/DksA family transcriptional regulator [soil metagenome]